MKILLITQWYEPVKGAAAKRTGKMARFLTDAGHKVTVLTSFPSYPTGIVPAEFKGKLWDKQKKDGIEIIRIWELPASTQDSTIKRLLNMLTFAKSAFWGALLLKPYDAVLVSSPSFLSGIAGLVNTRTKKSKFYFDIRDLWPDSAIELGVLPKTGFATEQMKKLEKKFYNRATKIFTATPGIKDHLLTEKIPSDKIEVLLNSVDTDKFKPVEANFDKYGFNRGDFICGYIGNHSRVYDLETVIKTAEITKKNEKIKYLLVGEGETKQKLKDLTQKLDLKNVFFMDQMSLDELAPITGLFSLGLAPISNIGVSQESFPSKTCEYFASGKPVAASLGGDMAKIITEYEVGFLYKPGDANALAEIILNLSKNPEKAQKMGQNARKLALDMFSDKIFAEKLISSLKD
ncbi:MAG: glycosyltransferase family 4 protein [Candidatus Berkelbacteria bacterium]